MGGKVNSEQLVRTLVFFKIHYPHPETNAGFYRSEQLIANFLGDNY